MASGRKKTYSAFEDVLHDVLDSDFEVDSSSEYGDLPLEEEELIDAGVDPDLVSAESSTPGETVAVIEPIAGPSSATDDSQQLKTKRPRKRAPPLPPPAEVQQGRWNDSRVQDDEPERMAFAPQRDPGFQLPTTQNWTPFDLFSLFFPEMSIASIVKNTNKYAEMYKSNKHYFRWSQLTVKEFLCFLALVIFMGLVGVPSLPEYWDKDYFFGQDFVRDSGMSKTRFFNILTVLHLCDIEQDRLNEAKKSRKEPYDPLFKLKPLLSEVQVACKAFYVPGQNVAIDERMVAFKGRIGMKQYIKDKPTKWGFKLWVLACANTGYTYRFQVYTGKRLTPTVHGLGYDVIMGLMDSLFGQGYHLFCDNFYTSPKLATALFDSGCFITGTLRENRIGFPKNLGNPLPKKADRGTSRWYRDGQKVFVKWKDTKDVCVLSTYYSGSGRDIIERGRGTKVNGRYVKQMVNIPPPMKGYNNHMGGVDLSDQLIKCYEIIKKTRKWWKTLFFHLIDVCIVNSFIIYKSLGKELSHKMYRKELPKSLLSLSGIPGKPSLGPGRPPLSKCRAEHCPVPTVGEPQENKSERATVGRKNCKLCYTLERKERKTPWKCIECKVPLCIQVDRNCFQRWHTAECDNFRY